MGLERKAWRASIKEGCVDEYRKRHDEIWQEMKEVLKSAGVKNYTIFLDGLELFGYYECEKGVEYADKIQNESEVVKKWNEYMSDILVWKDNKTQPKLEEVFRLD
jgi:L-rhamnose mutarotase